MDIDHAAFGTITASCVLHHANGVVRFGFIWSYYLLGGAKRYRTRALHGHTYTVGRDVTRHLVLVIHFMNMNVVYVQILWTFWIIGECLVVCVLPPVYLWIFTSWILNCREIHVRVKSTYIHTHQTGAYPGFCSMKRLGVFLIPLDGMLLIAGLPPAWNSPVPICSSGWRNALWELSVLPKNTTQCARPILEPRPLDPESSALTMKPPRLYKDVRITMDSMEQPS